MSAVKIFLICVAGAALNLSGSQLVKILELPLYLDTVGTIFIAALGGYVPGIAVGFFTNLMKAVLFEPREMYFCSVSVLIAIFTTFAVRQKIFKSLIGAVILLLPLTFLVSTSTLLIEKFLNATSILQTVDAIETSLGQNFLSELADKSVSLLAAYLMFKFTPTSIKNVFRTLGQKQAPLSDEMKRIIDKEKYLSRSSLRTKMLLILTLSSLLITFAISLISFLLFRSTAVDERIKTVDGMVAVVVSELNPYYIDDYIKYGRAADGYIETEGKLYAIKNASFDAKFLYVYKIEEDGCHVVFDLDTGTVKADKPGDVLPLEEELLPYRDDLLAGRPIPPIITDDNFGYLITLYKPVYDGSGRCRCYAAIDYSMDMLTDYTRNFIIKMLALFAGCFIFILAVGLVFVENNIILPVNTMAYCARNFSYDDANKREEHIERIESLKIHTGDEIENLYSALLRTTENVLRYLESLQRAKVRVADMQQRFTAMDELAHKDSLTGIKNKAAYDEKLAELDEEILSARAKFCIVMVDVNFLKRVNDTYGHERGNTYLMNACRLICAVFGEGNVYRIGGDEFVVILEGDRVSLIKYLVAQFNVEMNRKNSNVMLNPWEKVSAAIGVAYFKPVYDKNAETVFKRADAQMYQNKIAMKAARV